MKRRVAAAVVAILILWPAPAGAWDPFPEDDSSASSPPGREPDPAPFIAPPPGIYYVTDTYVADVVTSSGPLTTYSTTTIHESTGSYARVLESVATGASSVFDGAAFNGRRALADGRLVAGTYYENYVIAAGDFIPISIVFFQDDAELARLLAAQPKPGAAVQPSSPPATSTRPESPGCCLTERPGVTIPSPAPRRLETVRPGISLLPLSAPLQTLEVLRGRAIALYPRAFAGDRELPVRSWTIARGDTGDSLVTAGSGADAFRTSWSRLAPVGSAYEVVFTIEVDTPDGGRRTIDAAIAVVVRSPALEH